jgi:uncharacterized surface protein with fasciclin (FAS1) repeats
MNHGRRTLTGIKGPGATAFAMARALLLPLMLPLLLGACSAGEGEGAVDAPENRRAAVEPASAADAIARLPEFSTLRQAVTLTGRCQLIGRGATVTLLAPRDTAFARLGAEGKAALLAEPARARLARIVDLHIIPRALRAEELQQLIRDGGGSTMIASRAGPLTFTSDGATMIVTAPDGSRATIGLAETSASGSTLYVLDRVLGTSSGE